MEITTLKFNNCGASLDIKPKIKFFICTFCKSSLTINKSGNIMFTEVLDEIKKDTETIIDNTDEMLVEKKIARLDRDWDVERENFRFTGDDGVVYYPDPNVIPSNVFNYIFLIVGWLIFMIIISTVENTEGLAPLFIFIGTLVFILMGVSFHFDKMKKERYLIAKQEYDQKRKSLLSELKK